MTLPGINKDGSVSTSGQDLEYRAGYEAGYKAGKRSKVGSDEMLCVERIDSIIKQLERIANTLEDFFQRRYGT